MKTSTIQVEIWAASAAQVAAAEVELGCSCWRLQIFADLSRMQTKKARLPR
jgi:hypothetical protein